MTDFSKLAEAYNEAEAAIRSVEVLTTRAPIPALNEMRYAGCHAVALILTRDESKRNEELSKTISHCRRAYFDAQSVLLLTLYARVKNIREGLGLYLHFFPEMVGPSYWPKKEAVEQARTFIETLRSVKEDSTRWEKREELYEMCKPHIEACRAYIQIFEAIREELCSKVDAAKKQEKDDSRSRKINLLIGIAGVIATILLGIAGICFAG